MSYKRIFWILKGDINLGSARIHGVNVHLALIELGYVSKILHSSKLHLSKIQIIKMLLFLGKGDLVVFQKRKERSLSKFMALLKIKGVGLAFVDCDLPLCDESLLQYIDFIICPSKTLTELYKNKYPKKKIKYIPDAVEFYSDSPQEFNYKAIYFGEWTKERMQKINSIKILLATQGWSVSIMSDHLLADIPWFNWNDEKRFEIIKEHSICIIPILDNDSSKFKSANRVLQSLALGNIVLCGDIPSYQEVIKNGENGFICSTPEQWVDSLAIISNEETRRKIIQKGRDTAENFSMMKIIPQWINFLNLE